MRRYAFWSLVAILLIGDVFAVNALIEWANHIPYKVCAKSDFEDSLGTRVEPEQCNGEPKYQWRYLARDQSLPEPGHVVIGSPYKREKFYHTDPGFLRGEEAE